MDNLMEARNYKVVKANKLIQQTRYNLSEQEQKILLCVISKIRPDDKEFQEYQIDLREFCEVCGIDYDGGANYQSLRDTIKKLRDKSFWVRLDNGCESLCSWLQKARIYPNDSTVTIRLDEDLKPYLLQLKANFTEYELEYSLAMHGKYCLRIYELLKSYAFIGKWEVSLSDLRSVLAIPANEYSDIRDFKKRVIGHALKEINKCTDLSVEYESVTKKRKVVGFIFNISRKDYLGQVEAIRERDRRLD